MLTANWQFHERKQKENHVLWSCGRQNTTPPHCKDVNTVNPGMDECITWQKWDFVDIIIILYIQMEEYLIII